jgi:signal transduction histidine kinase
MVSFYRWLTRSGFDADDAAPVEAIALRLLGLAYLVVFIVDTVTTRPRPGVHGRGILVLVAMIAFVVAAIASQPRRADMDPWRRIATLLIVTAATSALAAVQPNGIWPAGPYFVGIMAALRLERRAAVAMLTFSVGVLLIVSAIAGRGSAAPAVLVGAVPWFLVMRMLRVMRGQRDELAASRAAEARAAAAAERGRLAREMHDVLAHSLSALALQLETTRLLARDRGVDDDVERALDQAHHLAVSGLEEARRAIAAERGEELPGPERIELLADAFGEQSGLPVAVEVRGQPRELAPDARLAVYRTAQEALTNVRRHATPERVEVRLDYLPGSTVLVVEDHAVAGAPPPIDGAPPPIDGAPPPIDGAPPPIDGAPPPIDWGPARPAAGGFGLTGMRERAELLGGELIAEPTGDGFRVELRLPA